METVMFWSCSGIDRSDLSYSVAQGLSASALTMIAELPCLGIPRLGFASGIIDTGRDTEAAIEYFEQRKNLSWDLLNQAGRQLYVLPASVSPSPDYPISEKFGVSALTRFVPALAELARSGECEYLVLECQGQITSPMTFFSLKAAGHVVIPVEKVSDAAYALACVKRLSQAYDMAAAKFTLAYAEKTKALKSAVSAYKRDGVLPLDMKVTPMDSAKILRALHNAFAADSVFTADNAGVAPDYAFAAGYEGAASVNAGTEADKPGTAAEKADFASFHIGFGRAKRKNAHIAKKEPILRSAIFYAKKVAPGKIKDVSTRGLTGVARTSEISVSL